MTQRDAPWVGRDASYRLAVQMAWETFRHTRPPVPVLACVWSGEPVWVSDGLDPLNTVEPLGPGDGG